jgi:hypothetical protein
MQEARPNGALKLPVHEFGEIRPSRLHRNALMTSADALLGGTDHLSNLSASQ